MKSEIVKSEAKSEAMLRDLFSRSEISLLRNELRECELDCWQAGELIEKFVRGRGFGISSNAARELAAQIDSSAPLEDITRHLESVALVM
jgi:hypothetical protein